MVFIETSLFTRLLPDRLSDDEYRAFQNYLAECPDAGDIVQGAGGLRKVRWAAKGKGKRGGVRVIYYWYVQRHHIYFDDDLREERSQRFKRARACRAQENASGVEP